jgi:hypothetical protein
MTINMLAVQIGTPNRAGVNYVTSAHPGRRPLQLTVAGDRTTMMTTVT